MSLTEKAAYIKGMVEGMNLNTETGEGKIIKCLLDLVEEMANDVVELKEASQSHGDYLDELDVDLALLEDMVYDDIDCCDDCFDDCECDGVCDECECDGDCDCCEKGEPYDFFKVVCPNCNDEVYLDNSIDPSTVICPSCHNEFSVVDGN